MTRSRWMVTLLALSAACSGGSEQPGAVLRGPGALAVFDGIVAHGNGAIRPYLAVANERGDELRLIDTTDNQVVTSPGLAFPLSVPSSGRPLFLAAAGLKNEEGRPDALAVIAAGSNVVELVDTWSGHPTVVTSVVGLPVDAEVLSMTGAVVPGGADGAARFLVGLSGGRLAVLDAVRVPASDEITLSLAATLTLGFDAVSLAQGGAPGYPIYAATRDGLPGSVFGVAKIALPAVLAGWSAASSVTALDAGVQTEAVAVASFDPWVFPPVGAGAYADSWGPSAERVIAVPIPGGCGLSPEPIRCLIALDPVTGERVPDPLSSAPIPPPIHPLPIPAPVSAILAAGRSSAALVSLTSGAGTVTTTGVAAISADDGRVYLADLARWTLLSDTSPVVGAGRTRVATATSTGAIGLWELDLAHVPVPPEPPSLSAVGAYLPARVRVAPGFTPDDEWTLTYQGVLPFLERRAAVVGRDGASYWVAVQIGSSAPIFASAELGALGVQADPALDDTILIEGIEGVCPGGYEATVASPLVAPDLNRPGGAAALAAPGCLTGLTDGSRTSAVVTFRAGGLVLAGKKHGHAGRPVATSAPTAADEFKLPGSRLFHVTDACTTTECVGNWPGLTFPFPTGDALGFFPGYVTPPSRGEKISFTTASGQVPSGRRPTVKGTVLASSPPTGLAVFDKDPLVSGSGVVVYASYPAGMVITFSTAAGAASMAVIR